jgi:hypothetical protein
MFKFYIKLDFYITCTPSRNPVTNLYTNLSLTDEIPVCSSCRVCYNETEDEDFMEEKYLSFVDCAVFV